MHFVLVHGWGFDARFWTPLVARLQNASVTRVDLGFIGRVFGGNVSEASSDWPEDAIVAGHSLGVSWLLKEGAKRCKGFVSMQGFDRFCPHVPEARVAALKRGLDRDPAGTMQAFWRSCGVSDFAATPALNVARLREGLDWLMHWDERAAKKALECPMLILAARDDAIVPSAMTEAVWAERKILWSPSGGHVLPLSHPDWCARHVLEFANSLPS